MDLADQEDESREAEDAGHCDEDPLGIGLHEEDRIGGHYFGLYDEKRCRLWSHPGSLSEQYLNKSLRYSLLRHFNS